MRRVLDLRIVRWERKLAAVIGVWLTGAAIMWLLPDAIPAIVRTLLGSLLTVGSFLLCARVFRGRGEPVEPPRPWWRMTAGRRLSARLGFLFAILALWIATVALLDAVGVSDRRSEVGELAEMGVTALEFGALAFLYLNSAARLRALPPPSPPLRPSFRAPRALR